MKPVVFLGPSVPLAVARDIVDADFRPPAQMGDVYAAAQAGPPTIAVIDGYFENRPAVWHKEFLFAIAQGIRAIGGGSMGALRAAELHAFGMTGVGRIFEAYASGALEDDDEVAVVHASAEGGYRAVSVAMANIRFGLEAAAVAGAISETTRRALEDAAKNVFYPERSWDFVDESAASLGIAESERAALRDFLARERPDQKRDDALAVLAAVRDAAGTSPPAPASFTFEPSFFWDHLCSMWQRVGAAGSAQSPVVAEQVRNHVRLADSERDGTRRLGLLLVLAAESARRNDVRPPEARRAVDRFRRSRGLLSGETLRAWLAAQHVDEKELVELAQLEAQLAALERRFADRIDAVLPVALKLQNRYGDVVERVGAKWRALQSMGITAPTLEDAGVSFDDLMTWYRERYGPIHTDVETHAAELGFAWPRPFLDELIAEYVASAR
jgi:hypothetical protein